MQGVLVPAGTPQPIVDLLQSEIARIIALPEVKDKLLAIGLEPSGMSRPRRRLYQSRHRQVEEGDRGREDPAHRRLSGWQSLLVMRGQKRVEDAAGHNAMTVIAATSVGVLPG